MQQSKSLYNPIKRNNLVSNDLASNVGSKTAKTKQQLASARNDCLLFLR